MWLPNPLEVAEAAEEIEARLAKAQSRARRRLVEPQELLPSAPGEGGWKAPLEERLLALPPWGWKVTTGGGVAKAYLSSWSAETTLAATAWVRAPEGFPIAFGLVAGREKLSSHGKLTEGTKDYYRALAVEEVRRELEAHGLEEPTEEAQAGALRFRKRALSIYWEEVSAGEVRIPIPQGVFIDLAHAPETNARKLAKVLGLSPSQVLRFLLGKADEEEAEEVLALAGQGV